MSDISATCGIRRAVEESKLRRAELAELRQELKEKREELAGAVIASRLRRMTLAKLKADAKNS